jgi:hypothetical protein
MRHVIVSAIMRVTMSEFAERLAVRVEQRRAIVILLVEVRL